MATISGSLRYDRDRTAISSPNLAGIANVPIVLQDTATDATYAVYTDADGNYTFTNVPDGNYRIVESYGTPASASPGDFSRAVPGSPATGVVPPISYVNDPPPGATNLDCTTPNTLLVTVSGSDLTDQDILNGPVTYTPIQTIMDTNVIISPANLITKADDGTFGTYPQGTAANTGAVPNPYPDIGTEFIYTTPNPASVTPVDGQYTIQNIMNNATANEQMTWWRVADHTTGNETGRMMVVNGARPDTAFFQQSVDVTPNTYYLLSAWILNLAKSSALVNPQLGVKVSGANGQVLYSATLGTLIPTNFDNPEWKQIGTVINSQDNNTLTVEFISMGPAAFGNDYAIDDIALNEVTIAAYAPVKSASAPAVNIGDPVTYTVTLSDTGSNPLSNLFFKDTVPEGFSFVPGSVTVNGVSYPAADPNTGFAVPDIPGGESLTVTFTAVADVIPAVNPTINNAQVDYDYTPVDGGIPDRFTKVSNDVPVVIDNIADLSVTKQGDRSPVRTQDVLTYTIVVSNNGPGEAAQVTLTDEIPVFLTGAEYSSDGGVTWQSWNSSLDLGTMAKGASNTYLIRSTVGPSATGVITNTATVSSITPDPNPSNNSGTEITPIHNSADLAITKQGDQSPVQAGNVLTYTLNVINQGPDEAKDVTVTDEIPSSLTGTTYSTDGGATWQPWNGSYDMGTLANGATGTLLVRGTVSRSATGVIANTATVSSTTPDPDPDNNSGTEITPVNQYADLALTKQGSQSPVQAGNLLTYTINVINNGPSDAQEVIVTDEVPPALTGVEYSVDGGATWQLWSGYHVFGPLADGASANLLIRGTVSPSATGVITNTAAVNSTTPDPDPENNTGTAITPINTSADLSITKKADKYPVSTGNVLTYTLDIQNHGPNDAQNVTVIDEIPSSLSNVEYSADGGVTWQPWNGTLDLRIFAAGVSAAIFIRGTVNSSATGDITNTAVINSTTPDPDPDNNTDTVVTPIITAADLSITKQGDRSPVQVGNVLTYTLTITNHGPDDAQETVVNDSVPSSLTGVEYSADDCDIIEPTQRNRQKSRVSEGWFCYFTLYYILGLTYRIS